MTGCRSGSADEQKPAADGTVEAWGRAADNPVGGWYGLRKGYRGRFGMYIPPLMEALGLAELEHNPKNNRMRAHLRSIRPRWRSPSGPDAPIIGPDDARSTAGSGHHSDRDDRR